MTDVVIAVVSEPDTPPHHSYDTAERWSRRLDGRGHNVTVAHGTAHDLGQSAELDEAEVLVALSARRTSAAATTWQRRHPGRPTIVGITGADLAFDMPSDHATMACADAADALVTFHSAAAERLRALDASWASKTHTIQPTIDPPIPARQPPFDEFRVVVLAPMQAQTDPLLTAQAASMLSPTSRVSVHHGGRATDDDWLLRASSESASNARYIWHGELNRSAGIELLASAHVVVCTSRPGDDPSVIDQAIAVGVPVVATRTTSSVGLLGDDHPGLFAVGDHLGLASILDWLELSPKALTDLGQRSIARQPLNGPAAEADALDNLVRSLSS